jgi:uncharacterized protein YaiI (UPF0178 family)
MTAPRPTIWIDADACPGVIRDILLRAARRTGIALMFVANHPIAVPGGPNIGFIQVQRGFDVADDEIAARMASGDLVVTQDVPLAAAAIRRGGTAVSPRGEPFTAETIGERLAMRDFLESLRSTGVNTGGPAPLGPRDSQAFARHLDGWLTRNADR